ncbi:hypothetical protein [Aliterella atlantica]|nr:hypothetical protein [Aliterella atlantica]
MSISQTLAGILQYLSEGVARIFSPTDDEYPIIGVQPFAGEPYKQGADW